MDLLTDIRKSAPRAKTWNTTSIKSPDSSVHSSWLSHVGKMFNFFNTVWNPFSVMTTKNELLQISLPFYDEYTVAANEENVFNHAVLHSHLFSNISQDCKLGISSLKACGFENLSSANPKLRVGNALDDLSVLTNALNLLANSCDFIIPEINKRTFLGPTDMYKCNSALLKTSVNNPSPDIECKSLIPSSKPPLLIISTKIENSKELKNSPVNSMCHEQVLPISPLNLSVNIRSVIRTAPPTSVAIVMGDIQVETKSIGVKPAVMEKVGCSIEVLNQELTVRKNKKMNKLSKKRRRRQRKKKNAAVRNRTMESQQNGQPNNSKHSGYDEVDSCNIIFEELPSPPAQCTVTSSFDICVSGGGLYVDMKQEKCQSDATYVNPALSFILGHTLDSESEDETDCSFDDSSCSILEDHTYQLDNVFGTYFSSFCAVQSNSIVSDVTSVFSVVDLSDLSSELKDINRQWQKETFNVPSKPKSPTKVSFAPDHELTDVFPVEVYDRKGEWEIYASERLRFKRRIEEAEKILSPCLSQSHREKVFMRMQTV